jgi:hypothetical protein
MLETLNFFSFANIHSPIITILSGVKCPWYNFVSVYHINLHKIPLSQQSTKILVYHTLQDTCIIV